MECNDAEIHVPRQNSRQYYIILCNITSYYASHIHVASPPLSSPRYPLRPSQGLAWHVAMAIPMGHKQPTPPNPSTHVRTVSGGHDAFVAMLAGEEMPSAEVVQQFERHYCLVILVLTPALPVPVAFVEIMSF